MRWPVALTALLLACSASSTRQPPSDAQPGNTMPPSQPGADVEQALTPEQQEAQRQEWQRETRHAQAGPAPSGPFNKQRVKEIVRANFDQVGQCYSEGLERDPSMKGTIEVHLAIADDGFVIGAKAPRGKDAASDALTDAKVVRCVEGVFMKLRFPETERGLVNMVYPVVLRVE